MGRIAVFDSGLGSLSLIGAIRAAACAEIIYLADRRSYPYGTKTRSELYRAVSASIETLRERFAPDVIVVGSNTPSLLVPELLRRRVIGVVPPIRAAARISKTRKIAVLATRSVTQSSALLRHIAAQTASSKCRVTRVDASKLVDLVETAKFLTQRTSCSRVVRDTLARTFERNSIDVATLSSTHLPLLLPILNDVFPNITFIDPAQSVAARAVKLAGPPSKRATLHVYATSGAATLQRQLALLGLSYKVTKI